MPSSGGTSTHSRPLKLLQQVTVFICSTECKGLLSGGINSCQCRGTGQWRGSQSGTGSPDPGPPLSQTLAHGRPPASSCVCLWCCLKGLFAITWPNTSAALFCKFNPPPIRALTQTYHWVASESCFPWRCQICRFFPWWTPHTHETKWSFAQWWFLLFKIIVSISRVTQNHDYIFHQVLFCLLVATDQSSS